jgi:hypothetical protein
MGWLVVEALEVVDIQQNQAERCCLVPLRLPQLASQPCIAQMLTANVKGKDFVARYGGEEFAILLGDVDEETTPADKVIAPISSPVSRFTIFFAAKREQIWRAIAASTTRTDTARVTACCA